MEPAAPNGHMYNARLKAYGRKLGLIIPKVCIIDYVYQLISAKNIHSYEKRKLVPTSELLMSNFAVIETDDTNMMERSGTIKSNLNLFSGTTMPLYNSRYRYIL